MIMIWFPHFCRSFYCTGGEKKSLQPFRMYCWCSIMIMIWFPHFCRSFYCTGGEKKSSQLFRMYWLVFYHRNNPVHRLFLDWWGETTPNLVVECHHDLLELYGSDWVSLRTIATVPYTCLLTIVEQQLHPEKRQTPENLLALSAASLLRQALRPQKHHKCINFSLS
jgi:hypothetical protein